MKFITLLTFVSLICPFASAKNLEGKCARIAANAAMNAYIDLPEGNYFQVVSSKVSRNLSIYKVVAVAMDGSGEPFTLGIDVTFTPNTCKNPKLSYSK